ncbi:uncharacterized protein CHSO_3173 [Chryseobacterium sp. StRB126]|uniref:hypothetical protein n=1 Tax=Chryseobacterium sp. StRB126 TaxID=878220 RepID=UPI0004E983BF|nr:hypothetical protein [Chryseobacterium sp. StRB126]BAP32210.1 uncharacterized protein CHSO_3173 [Chryseobacterium sp. StRB126]
MKKIILLASALSGIIVLGQASIDPGTKNDIQKIFPTTPETYSMFKAGDFPVDYRTGKLNVSVPLYEIKTRYGVTIPIGLTYNTGGIKVDETSGVAGLGWSLAIPNSISVEMHGKDDIENEVWFPQQPGEYAIGNLHNLPPDIYYRMSNIKDGIMDSQPDIYHYNLPTISGSFIKDSNGNFRTIPYEDVKISYADNKFIIIDSKGVIYTLSKGNSTSTISTGGSSESYRSSFILEKIKFPNNEEVSFNYGKRMLYKNITHSFTDIYIPVEHNDPMCAPANKNLHSTTNNMYIEALLTEIVHDDEKLTFNYANTIQGVQGRKDLDGAVDNTFALSEIIGTYKDRVIQKMALEHQYFETSGGDKPYKNFRLKLNKVRNLLDNTEYSFEYNENDQPSLGSFSQDIWGYYNGQNNYGLIPNMQYFNRNYTQGGNRNVYPQYSQAYVLKKINYPTKGSSSFTYENNNVWKTLVIPQEEITTKSNVIGVLNPGAGYAEETGPEFYLNDAMNVEGTITYLVDWTNSCANNIPGGPGSIQVTNGNGYLEELQPTGSWKRIAQFRNDVRGPILEVPGSHNPDYKKRLRVMLQTNEPEPGCSVSLSVLRKRIYRMMVNENAVVGGLRIKSINDFDGQTNYTKRTFEYNKPDSLSTQSSGSIASPLEFLKMHYSVVKPESEQILEFICDNYGLSADQAVNSSLSGRDVVSYEYVTEHTLGKGKKMYQFPVIGGNLNITIPLAGWNPYRFLNKNILNEKSYSESGALLQEKSYEYENLLLKNPLSSDHLPDSPYSLALSTSFAFFNLNHQFLIKINDFYVVESGKWLLTKSTDKNYLNGILTSETVNSYSLSDINKPINLMKSETRFFDGSASEISYQYAHEKNNQKLINANIIATPLESSSIQKRNVSDPSGTTISKTETKYDDPANLLPTSVLSFDLQNSQAATTEVTYDKYDAKGNLQQYTTKEGIPTVIIWGYESILPIAKIVGAKLSDINQSFIDSIVIASQTDGSQGTIASEERMLNALDGFRNNSVLSGYQITTYSYDPLIGVRSITPPSGIREVYLYDTAGRLKEVREHNNTGKLLKEFNYHYKN